MDNMKDAIEGAGKLKAKKASLPITLQVLFLLPKPLEVFLPLS